MRRAITIAILLRLWHWAYRNMRTGHGDWISRSNDLLLYKLFKQLELAMSDEIITIHPSALR